MLPKYVLLSRHIRDGLTEEQHFGIIIEYSKKGIKKLAGEDKNYPFYLRSCMKPFQLAAISQIIKEFNLTQQEIAVSTASHSGEDFHIETVLNILKKIGLKKADLLCPAQMPLNFESQKKLIKLGQLPESIHNNCSGKHAAMLAFCVLKGYDTKNYNDINHPMQKYILNFTAQMCGIRLKKCMISKDGCTLPVIATPLKNLAQGFLNVYNNYPEITNAIINNPYYAGGHGRLDSEIIKAGLGNLTAKVGAGNLCCVADLKNQTCIVIKLSDPDNYSRGLILTSLLNKMNKFKDFENSVLSKMYSTDITDETGFILGKIQVLI